MYTEIDKLNRTAFIDTLEKIIDKKFADFEGFSFAIDGRWGCGKTFIINMLEERIKQKYLVIKYNCWKHDYYEEPVEAIMSVIADRLNEIAAEENPPSFVNKETLKNLAKFMVGTGFELFKAGTNIDLKSIWDMGAEAIKKDYEVSISKDFDSKDTITRAIKAITFALSLAHSDKKVLFIVDELDRCLPEYAIKVLERLHHVNEGSKFVTLLSINKNELAGSIAKVFGRQQSKTNFADYYLQKFTDAIIPIPPVTQTNTVLDKFNLSKGFFDIDINKSFAIDLQNFFSNVVVTIPVRSIEAIDKKVSTINSLIGPRAQKPTVFAYCIAILKVYETILSKGKFYLEATDKEYFFNLTFMASEMMDYNEIEFSSALKSWSKTLVQDAINREGQFIGRTNRLSKFQDYVKTAFTVRGITFITSLKLLPQDNSYLQDFITWLDQLS